MSNTRNLAICLRGGAQPRDVALAVALGLLAGAVTGWNLSLAALLLLVVLLNVHSRTFLASWAAGLAGTWLLGKYAYRMGQVLLESTPLGDGVAALGDGPLVALLDWDRYTLVGGAAAAVAISLPAARLAAKLARRRCEREPSDPRWLRRWGMAGAAGVLAATGLTSTRLVSARVERELLSQLTEVNGAPVSAGDFQFSLWTGTLYLGDVQLADPRRLDRDRLRIGRVTAQLHPGELLRGRLYADLLLLEHLRGDVARRQPAESNEFAPPVIDMPTFDETASAPTHETVELETYLRIWPALRDRLTACEPWVKALSRVADCDEDTTTTRPEHSSLGRQRPRVFVAKLRAAGLASSWGLGARATLTVTHLSSRPNASGRLGRLDRPGNLEPSTHIELAAPECATEISAEMDPRNESKRITLTLHSHGLALDDLVDSQPLEGLIEIADGAVRLTGEGWIDPNRLELSMHVEIDSLDARVTAPVTLGGISASVWDDGLRRLGALRTDVVLAGAWDSPTVTADRRRVVEQFKHQLRAAGEHRLVRAIEEQLARGETASANATSADDAVVAREDSRDGVCKIVDQRKAPPPRYAYPSTDDDSSAAPEAQSGDVPATQAGDGQRAGPDRGAQFDRRSGPTRPTHPGAEATPNVPTPNAPSPGTQGVAEPRVTPAAETVVTPAAEAVAPVASQPGGPSASEQLKTTGNASPSTVTNAGTETPAVTAPAVEEPLGDGRSQRVVVQQPADDDPKAAWSRHYGGATVRAARPTGRRRARAAAASTTAPAPRWTPGPDADAGAEGSANSAGPTAADDLPDVTGLTTAGQETRKQPPRRDAVKAGGWYEDQGDPEKPEPREKLLTRWSNTMRSKFGRMLPRRHDDDFGPDDPYDLDRRTVAAPTVEPPDDDEPIAEEATSGEKKPWFRIFRR